MKVNWFQENLFEFNGKHRLESLEGLRALAVVLVFNVHLFGWHYSQEYNVSGHPLLIQLFSTLHSGHIGVDLFFILSGFFIFNVLQKKQSFVTFIYNRYSRIMPVVIVTTLPLFLSQPKTIPTIIDNILFLKLFKSSTYLNYVTWSLSYEVYFYLLLAGLVSIFGIARMKQTRSLLIVAFLVWCTQFFITVPAIPQIGRFMAFFWGIMLSILYEKQFFNKNVLYQYLWIPGFMILIGAMYVWANLGVAARSDSSIFVQNLFYFFVQYSFFLIIGSVFSGSKFLNSIFSSQPLRILGVTSYSFYMIHTLYGIPLGASFSKLVHIQQLIMPVHYIVSFAFSLILSVFFYIFLEKPYFTKRAR